MIALVTPSLPDGYDDPASPTAGPTAGKAEFTDATFRASVQDMRFMAQGDVRLVLTVPYSDRQLAASLMDAHGLQLTCRLIRHRRGGKTA